MTGFTGVSTLASYTRPVVDTPDSRERILEATIALIEANGEAGLRLEQVAETAAVAKRSIYHFFGDREGLIVAAQADRIVKMMAGEINDVLDSLLDCVEPEDYVHLVLSGARRAVAEGRERRRLRLQVLGSADTRPNLRHVVLSSHQWYVEQLTKIAAFGQRRRWVQSTYSAGVLGEFWFAMLVGRYVTEMYADEATQIASGNAVVDAISYMMFGRTYPEYSSERA